MGCFIRKLSDILNTISLFGCGIFLVALVLAVMLQVVARYVFIYPPYWTEEFARYSMVWAGLLGATVSFKKRFDPELQTFSTEGKPRMTSLFAMVQTGAVLVFVIPILFHCFVDANLRLTQSFMARQMFSQAEALPISKVWVAASVPLALSVILIHLASRWSKNPKSTTSQGNENDLNGS